MGCKAETTTKMRDLELGEFGRIIETGEIVFCTSLKNSDGIFIVVSLSDINNIYTENSDIEVQKLEPRTKLCIV